MAWYDEMVPLFRGLIGDDDDISRYPDTRLEEILLNAAHLISLDATFDNDYTISLSEHTLTPDPTDLSDIAFINLVCLKAACILANAEMRLAVNKAMAIKDGPSSIDGRDIAKNQKLWTTDVCDNYKKALIDYKLGSGTPGQAIVGPYRSQYSEYSSRNRYSDNLN